MKTLSFRSFTLQGIDISARQAEMLAKHTAGAQQVDVRMASRAMTMRSLIALRLLRFRTIDRKETVLTAGGRPYAGRALAVAADHSDPETGAGVQQELVACL
jgi:hypothetical protein